LLLANLNTKTSLKKVIRRKRFAAKALKSYDSCKWFTGISGKKLRKLPDIARSAWPMQEPAIWIRC
jgi:hypothetical protein